MSSADEAVRLDLIARVASISDLLRETAAESEALRTLCPKAVDALREQGLFGIWVAEEAGGFDADVVTQIDVLVALARADMSACWTVMIGNSVISIMASGLPDDGFAEVFEGDGLPVAASSLRPTGSARRVEGGYLASGAWGFGSGIKHASFAIANCWLEGAEGEQAVGMVVPIDEVEVKDDWYVAGLCGSGSNSYAVSNVFVPDARVLGAKRRGRADRVEVRLRIPIEHAAVSLGGARRALDEIATQARTKTRLLDPNAVATQQHFQNELGRLESEWIALHAGVRESAARLEAAWESDPSAVDVEAAELRAICAYAVERSLAIGGRALRYAGAAAVIQSNVIQRIYRDLTVSAQHVMVSDVAYETFGKILVSPKA